MCLTRPLLMLSSDFDINRDVSVPFICFILFPTFCETAQFSMLVIGPPRAGFRCHTLEQYFLCGAFVSAEPCSEIMHYFYIHLGTNNKYLLRCVSVCCQWLSFRIIFNCKYLHFTVTGRCMGYYVSILYIIGSCLLTFILLITVTIFSSAHMYCCIRLSVPHWE